jgi:putative tryptophan/tyrosine transport system substrate-binding protein
MRRPITVALLSALILPIYLAEAQQRKKIPRIGVLIPTTAAASTQRIEALQRGLRELGYINGTSINLIYRYTDGKTESLPAIAAELVALNPDIILAANNTVAHSLSAATKTIPIVLLNAADPVVGGLAVSLARPGGNVTGLTNLTFDLATKRLELLKEIVPKLSRVAVLSSRGGTSQDLKELEAAALALQLELHVMEVRIADDLESAFIRAASAKPGALTMTADPTGIFRNNAQQIVNAAAKNKLPAIYPVDRYVELGGLSSYAANELENYRRAAYFVDKILKGAKPGELPIEQPTKFELVINLKTAKQIGLTIPPNVLARADKVIK